MNSILQDEAKALVEWDGQAEMDSIYQVLQHLSDTRSNQGKRYSLPLVWTYLLLGKAAGETTL